MMKEKIMFSVVIPTYNEATKEKEMREHMKNIENYFETLGQSAPMFQNSFLYFSYAHAFPFLW